MRAPSVRWRIVPPHTLSNPTAGCIVARLAAISIRAASTRRRDTLLRKLTDIATTQDRHATSLSEALRQDSDFEPLRDLPEFRALHER